MVLQGVLHGPTGFPTVSYRGPSLKDSMRATFQDGTQNAAISCITTSRLARGKRRTLRHLHFYKSWTPPGKLDGPKASSHSISSTLAAKRGRPITSWLAEKHPLPHARWQQMPSHSSWGCCLKNGRFPVADKNFARQTLREISALSRADSANANLSGDFSTAELSEASTAALNRWWTHSCRGNRLASGGAGRLWTSSLCSHRTLRTASRPTRKLGLFYSTSQPHTTPSGTADCTSSFWGQSQIAIWWNSSWRCCQTAASSCGPAMVRKAGWEDWGMVSPRALSFPQCRLIFTSMTSQRQHQGSMDMPMTWPSCCVNRLGRRWKMASTRTWTPWLPTSVGGTCSSAQTRKWQWHTISTTERLRDSTPIPWGAPGQNPVVQSTRWWREGQGYFEGLIIQRQNTADLPSLGLLSSWILCPSLV